MSALHIASGQAKRCCDRRGTRFLVQLYVRTPVCEDGYKRDERFRGNVGAGLVDSSEIGPYDSECGDLYGEGCSVEHKCSYELGGGLSLGTRYVGPARNG